MSYMSKWKAGCRAEFTDNVNFIKISILPIVSYDKGLMNIVSCVRVYKHTCGIFRRKNCVNCTPLFGEGAGTRVHGIETYFALAGSLVWKTPPPDILQVCLLFIQGTDPVPRLWETSWISCSWSAPHPASFPILTVFSLPLPTYWHCYISICFIYSGE